MRKKLVKLGLVAGIATTSLFGFTYEIKQGWQQLGAIKDFDDLKSFDNASCVEYLWHYDLDEPVEADKWKLHISDGKNYNYCGETFSSLDKGDGFWLKASGECNITVEDSINCPSDNMAPPTPPSFDGSCDVNDTGNANNKPIFSDDYFTLYKLYEGTSIYHGASAAIDRHLFFYPKVKFTEEPKTIKMTLGNELEIVYYNSVKSAQWGDDYGVFEYMSINGVVSKKNMTTSETEEFIKNNISIEKYPYSWTSNGGYLTFTKEEQINQIKYYLEKK